VELVFNCNFYRINLFQKIDFNKYDVIHSHMLRPDFYVWWHRKKNNTPLFLSTLHQNIYDNLKGNYNSILAFLFEKIWLLLLKRQDIVVVLTDIMKNDYRKKTHLNLITIYNGRNYPAFHKPIINIDDIYKINQLKLQYKIIGSHCLLTKRKGIHQIIMSLEYLKDYALVIIGNGQELNKLKIIARDLGVLDRCFFTGYREDAISYLKYFDLYVMSSYSEGFPLGLLEAGLSELPIICSDIPIFRELFSENEVCFFELDNIYDLVEAINLSFDNKEKFSKSINKLISEKYSLSNMVINYLKLYQNV
jgi:glycosyltransferase involved in cell wall biosynthesis